MEGKDLGVFASIFQSGSRTYYFYKIKDSHCDFVADSNQNNDLSGRHVARDILIFLLQSLGFVINL